MMNTMTTAKEVNEYIAEEYKFDRQNEEKREIAEKMIDDMKVDFFCEEDDLFTFVFRVNGERFEKSYRSGDEYSAEIAVDKFIENHPYAIFATFVD